MHLQASATPVSDDPLRSIADLASRLGAAALAAEAGSLADRLAAGRLYLACVGQFKRGKSTLLNTLIGEAVLPVGVRPVTSIVTTVRYGGARRAVVAFLDGRTQEVPFGALERYVTEEGNPDNTRRVAAAEVFVPAPILGGGLCLVDTPGIGSVFSGNTAVTRRFVPHLDAALVVLGADPPISGDELALVSDILRETDALIFLLAKADRSSDAELAEARAFTERVIARRLDRAPDATLVVSAAERAGEGRPTRDWAALEDALARLGSTERAARIRARHARGVARLGGQLRLQLAEERRVLAQPLDEAERRVASLGEWTARAGEAVRELSFRFAAEIKYFAAGLEQRRVRFLERAGPASARALDFAFDELTASGPRLRDLAIRLAFDLSRREVEAWSRAIEPDADAEFRALAARLVELANGCLASLAEAEPALRGLPPLHPECGLHERRRFAFNGLWTLASPPLGRRVLHAAVPALARRPAARRDAHAHLGRLLDTNSSRVVGDLLDRAQEARRQIEGEIGRRLDALHEAGARALARARAAHADGRIAVQAELSRVDALERAAAAVLADAAGVEPEATGSPA